MGEAHSNVQDLLESAGAVVGKQKSAMNKREENSERENLRNV